MTAPEPVQPAEDDDLDRRVRDEALATLRDLATRP